MLTKPHWIGIGDQEKRSIRFIWDDGRALLDFTADAGPVLSASMKMSLRARMVLSMGLYEWIVWRFEGLHQRLEPLQIAQAGWCAMVDPRYMRFFELPREKWRGPIEGPLWCAATWLQPAMSQGHLFPKGVYDAISFLTRMGLHILPNVDRFQDWLQGVLDRLIQKYPLTPDNPFEDLFNRRVRQRLGPLIGRNVLDLGERPDKKQIVSFLSQTLHEAHVTGNPFLSSPEDLKEAGFTEIPYVIPAS